MGFGPTNPGLLFSPLDWLHQSLSTGCLRHVNDKQWRTNPLPKSTPGVVAETNKASENVRRTHFREFSLPLRKQDLLTPQSNVIMGNKRPRTITAAEGAIWTAIRKTSDSTVLYEQILAERYLDLRVQPRLSSQNQQSTGCFWDYGITGNHVNHDRSETPREKNTPNNNTDNAEAEPR